jgi:hypothetical protein
VLIHIRIEALAVQRHTPMPCTPQGRVHMAGTGNEAVKLEC